MMSKATVKLALTLCVAAVLIGSGIGGIVSGTSFSEPQVASQGPTVPSEAKGPSEEENPRRTSPKAEQPEGEWSCSRDRCHGCRGKPAMEIVKTTKDSDAKWMAIRILGNLRYQPAIPLLLETLSDPQPYVRSNAARALGDMKVASAARHLTQLLNKETNGGVIQQTALALGNLHHADALPALKAAAKHEDVQTRMWVLQAVGRLGGKGDVPFLARYLLGDLSSSVQMSAAEAIEQITGVDFGFPKRSGPPRRTFSGIQRARAWWEKHKREYEHPDAAVDPEHAPVDVRRSKAEAADQGEGEMRSGVRFDTPAHSLETPLLLSACERIRGRRAGSGEPPRGESCLGAAHSTPLAASDGGPFAFPDLRQIVALPLRSHGTIPCAKGQPICETFDGHDRTRLRPATRSRHPIGWALAHRSGQGTAATLPRRPRRGGLHGNPASSRSDGPRRLPRRARPGSRRRRRLPGHLPRPRPPGGVHPPDGLAGQLAPRRSLPHCPSRRGPRPPGGGRPKPMCRSGRSATGTL